MKIVTPHWERTLELESWGEGMEKTFIVIRSPAKERETATLRIDDEMWNYLPNTDKTIKIPPSMMMGSWMGSDFTNDDLVRQTTMQDDYTNEIIERNGDNHDYIYIKSVPKELTLSVWGSIITAVREENTIPVFQEYFDDAGVLVRNE